MHLNLLAFAYGSVALLTVLLTVWRGHQNLSSMLCAVLLMGEWIVFNLAYASNAIYVYPLIDLAIGAFVFEQWRAHKAGWAFVLGLLFIADLTIHCTFWLVIPPTRQSWYYYALSLNVIFALQLLTVASTRAGDVWAVCVDFLSGDFGRRRVAGG